MNETSSNTINDPQLRLLQLNELLKQKFPSETTFNFYKNLVLNIANNTTFVAVDSSTSTKIEAPGADQRRKDLNDFIRSFFLISREDFQDKTSFVNLHLELTKLLEEFIKNGIDFSLLFFGSSDGNNIHRHDDSRRRQRNEEKIDENETIDVDAEGQDENEVEDVEQLWNADDEYSNHNQNYHQYSSERSSNSSSKNQEDDDDAMFIEVSDNEKEEDDSEDDAVEEEQKDTTLLSSSCYDGRPLAQWIIEMLESQGVDYIIHTNNRRFVIEEILKRNKNKNDTPVDCRAGWVRIEALLMKFSEKLIRDLCERKKKKKDQEKQQDT